MTNENMSPPQFKVGQHVTYKAIGSPESNTPWSTGTIKKVASEDGKMLGHKIHPSAQGPCYQITNNHTGKTSAVYESKISGEADVKEGAK
ncbi:hypothetical protein K490DRAFT_65673 [Saccharata proteae CBS 121410]|uniref:Hypervirulence associated protein TUDOR domain-containing protein n=1 Tax=Saccharata proteae CBS 121410 TaxID=1314787 RepID=A0A9P4LVA0_9PEZI|nr:hypothetical protein K490DRAFT_65673 [Saccharata proteae CBS 121410]